jgi:hypothetical protein
MELQWNMSLLTSAPATTINDALRHLVSSDMKTMPVAFNPRRQVKFASASQAGFSRLAAKLRKLQTASFSRSEPKVAPSPGTVRK